MVEERESVRVRGCGVNGCLIAAVAIFVILLILLLIVAFFRFSEPPGELSAISYQLTALGLYG